MPTPSYPPTLINAVVKRIQITLNPGEIVTLVPSGSNGFFPTSSSFHFGNATGDVLVSPVNFLPASVYTSYPIMVGPGDKGSFVSWIGPTPQSFTADQIKLQNETQQVVTIEVVQIGF